MLISAGRSLKGLCFCDKTTRVWDGRVEHSREITGNAIGACWEKWKAGVQNLPSLSFDPQYPSHADLQSLPHASCLKQPIFLGIYDW